MKKAIVSSIAVVLLAGCDGVEGPAGPPGQDFLGQVFDVDAVFLDYSSELGYWSAAIDIPSRIEIYESDAVLAYRLVDVLTDDNGNVADVWEMLPNVYFLAGGDIIQYVFNHTFFDVELIVDGNHDLSDLDPRFTDDQSFRFVVVPSEFVQESRVDITNHDAVLDALGIVID